MRDVSRNAGLVASDWALERGLLMGDEALEMASRATTVDVFREDFSSSPETQSLQMLDRPPSVTSIVCVSCEQRVVPDLLRKSPGGFFPRDNELCP